MEPRFKIHSTPPEYTKAAWVTWDFLAPALAAEVEALLDTSPDPIEALTDRMARAWFQGFGESTGALVHYDQLLDLSRARPEMAEQRGGFRHLAALCCEISDGAAELVENAAAALGLAHLAGWERGAERLQELIDEGRAIVAE